jgi:hypothetical protein
VTEETPEERDAAIRFYTEQQAALGKDVSNLTFVQLGLPQFDSSGHQTSYKMQTVLKLQPPPLQQSSLSDEMVQRIKQVLSAEHRPDNSASTSNDVPNPVPDSRPFFGTADATVAGMSAKTYASLTDDKGRVLATIDVNGVVRIAENGLAQMLSATDGAKARTELLSKIFPSAKVTIYPDALTAPAVSTFYSAAESAEDSL